ncbi:MAG: hypothetical protein IPJ38_16155 [Dechloromonas sp.]|uniref:Uncharacterized protein n=1 Tax=Candidatus Dechloromonas phosphorivorans TaxID=2899244 RepID=A0A935KCX9_9RHOO|nr:hypothetical protein [Candidatus Dechloromonas phosphorivorans]
MANQNSTRTITNPTDCLYGVAIKSDGTFENVGIGSFDPSNGVELADRLTAMAEAIRTKSGQRQEAIRALA